MKCPNDDAVLVMTERQGIEIDYCPECRGVWLDRGELDKIVERTPNVSGKDSRGEDYTRPHQPPQHENRLGYEEYHKGSDDYRHKKRKKESFLGDLFDF